MSGGLEHAGDGGVERCVFCGAEAAGPCASCTRSVCGDCCTLTEGGAGTWAICLDCDRKGGRSLAGPWRGVFVWIGVVLGGLFAVVTLLAWCSR